MREIPLTKGHVALVDDENYDSIIIFTWRSIPEKHTNYAIKGWSPETHMQMANAVMGQPPKGYTWDHKDRNGLNNQKNNLRLATPQQNAANRTNTKKSLSSFRGVARYHLHHKWAARVKVDNKLIFLGFFDNKEEAARCYDKAAIKYFGEFANLNFP